MDLTEVIELMSIVDSMDNISEVTVTFGDSPSVSIKKENKTAPTLPPEQGFQVASLPQPKNGNLATPGQIKFALDLANKIGNGNMICKRATGTRRKESMALSPLTPHYFCPPNRK